MISGANNGKSLLVDEIFVRMPRYGICLLRAEERSYGATYLDNYSLDY